MFLAIDIGNTHTVIGLFKNDEIISSWRMGTPRYKYETADEIGILIVNLLKNSKFDGSDIKDIAICSVVPRVMNEVAAMSKKYFGLEPLIINSTIKSGLKIKYDFPAEIGADRIANSVAAINLYKAPAIVADIGTATTFDIISSAEEYFGGVIAPGIEISSEALFNIAAKLSKVDLSWPETIIGKNTYNGLRAGILFGFLGQVDYILKKIIEEMSLTDNSFSPVIIGTGGLSGLLRGRSKYIQIFDKDLTLKGIRLLFKKNRQ